MITTRISGGGSATAKPTLVKAGPTSSSASPLKPSLVLTGSELCVPHGLVLVPTRELAEQVAKHLAAISRHVPEVTVQLMLSGGGPTAVKTVSAPAVELDLLSNITDDKKKV